MTAYEMMVRTNHYLIKGGSLTQEQRTRLTVTLLHARSTAEQAERFYAGVKYPGNTNAEGRRMYPAFFIPPYNGGKKYKTVLGQQPKTHILSANLYELETLRLLSLFLPGSPEISDMVQKTLERLQTTCFGAMDDGVGECFDASLVVLRFLATAAPGETAWIKSRIDNYNRHKDDRKRPWYAKWYFWLCLSELPFTAAEPEISGYKGEMLSWLAAKSCVMNSEQDRTIHPVLLCILRNLLCQYPEYDHIRNRRPYISQKDKRLHFDIAR